MSFGSAIEAIVNLKNNRRESTAKTGKFLAPIGSGINGVESHITPTEKELADFREKIILPHKKKQRKIVMITAAFLLSFLLFSFYFMF